MLKLKKENRKYLKKPIGKLYSSIEDLTEYLTTALNENKFIISVGDVTTNNLQTKNIIPHLSIIDNLIERKPAQHDIIYDNVTLTADNPPGTITTDLWNKIEESLKLVKSSFKVLLVVNGEEDLAVIPCLILAPPGSLILYGQPGEGVVLCEADEYKQKAEKFIKMFEED